MAGKELMQSNQNLYHIGNIVRENLSKDSRYKDIEVGIAGSYSRGEANSGSDVDLVFDTDVLTADDFEHIKSLFPDLEVDILELPLLKAEDEENDAFLASIGLPGNEYSVSKNVQREVVWL